jgi:threonylcarbamoyladenosine tRNA methylthiotransferase MtaB
MNELERDLAMQYYKSLVGAPLEVLVEQVAEGRPGYVRGSDRRYVPIEIPGDESDFGQFVSGVGEATLDRQLRAIRRD